jgi:hypothetical protein
MGWHIPEVCPVGNRPRAMALAVALELGGLEVVAAIRPILHRDDLAAVHAGAQLVGGAVEEAGRTRRAPEALRGDRQRDGRSGERLAPEPLLEKPLELRQAVARQFIDEGADLPGQLHPNALARRPRSRQRVARAAPCDRHAARPLPCYSALIRAAPQHSAHATAWRRPRTRLTCYFTRLGKVAFLLPRICAVKEIPTTA